MQQQNKKVKFILGSTGSGKTRKMVEIARETLLGKNKENNIILIAVHNKDTATAIYNDLKKDAKHIRHLCLYIASNSYTKKTLITQSTKDKKFKVPRVILTTHAYLKKRGDSTFLYAFHLDLLWIKKKEPDIFIKLYIDEAHLYLDSLTWSLKIQGMYYIQTDLGFERIERPLPKSGYNRENVDATLQTVRHIYHTCKDSKNPRIMWDRGVLRGQTTHMLEHLYKPKYQVSFLNSTYGFIKEKEFHLNDVLNITPKYALINSNEQVDKIIKEVCRINNIEITSFKYYSYQNATNDLFLSTPYIIETIFGEHTNEPHSKFYSGFDFFSLVFIQSITDEMSLLSASFIEYHYDWFKWIETEVKVEQLNIEKLKQSDDYGCILSISTKSSSKILMKLKDINPLIHFSINKSESNNLAKNFCDNPENRSYFAQFEGIYKNEVKLISATASPTTSDVKPINLSYWGSTLSTGINLPTLHICSVDLKHSIPFIFIPLAGIKTSNELKSYIKSQLIENVIQMLSRICRNKGDQFKILILNRSFEKQLLTVEDEKSENIIDVILSYERFREKFKRFKVYNDVKIIKGTLSLLKEWVTDNQDISNNSDGNLILNNLVSEMIEHLKDKDNIKKNEILDDLPRPYNYIKKLTVIKEDQYDKDDCFSIMDSKKIIAVTCCNLPSSFLLTFFYSDTGSMKHYEFGGFIDKKRINNAISEIKQLLNRNVILIGFGLFNKVAPFLNYLLSDTKQNIHDLMSFIDVTDQKQRLTIKDLEKKVFFLIDLKKMCKSNAIIDLTDIGLQLDSKKLPVLYKKKTSSELEYDYREYQEYNERSLMIINELYRNFFRYNEIMSYRTFMAVLKNEFNYLPNNQYILNQFVETPTKKWTEPSINALKLNSIKIPSHMKLSCSKVKEVINEFNWKDNNLKSLLLNYYDNEFYFNKKDSGFFDKTLQNKMILDITLNSLKLRIGSGGLHSRGELAYLNSSDEYLLKHLDIRSFYPWVLTKYKLLKNSPLSVLFENMYQKRIDAIVNQEKDKAEVYKFIINSITGNLANKHSRMFDIQVRFDLIQISQILMLNWIDHLIDIQCSVFGVNTDGLIVYFQNKKDQPSLIKWDNLQDIPIIKRNLKQVYIKSNRISKIDEYGQFDGYGLNTSKSITSFSSFNLNKPAIIKDILESKIEKVQDNGIVLNKNLRKFCFYLKSSQTYNIILKDDNKDEEFFIDKIRYALSKNPTGLKVIKRSKKSGVDEVVDTNIIDLNQYTPLVFNTLNLKTYEKLAKDEMGGNFLSNHLNRNIDKQKITIESLNLPEKVTQYGKLFSLLPIDKRGFFPKDKWENVFVTSLTSYPNTYAIAIVMSPQNCFVIDVDEPSNLPKNIKDYILNNINDFIICYHDEKKQSNHDVIYNKRFKLLFKSNQNTYVKFQKIINLFDSIQIEINVKRAFTFFGFHRNGQTKYEIINEKKMTNLPFIKDDFFKLLVEHSKSIIQDGTFLQRNRSNYILKHKSFAFIQNKIEEFSKRYGGKVQTDTSDDSIHISTNCPNVHLHSQNVDQKSDFSIKFYKRTNTLVASCFHKSCKEANNNLMENLFGKPSR